MPQQGTTRGFLFEQWTSRLVLQHFLDSRNVSAMRHFMYANYFHSKQMDSSVAYANTSNVSGSLSRTGITFLAWPSNSTSSFPKFTQDNHQKKKHKFRNLIHYELILSLNNFFLQGNFTFYGKQVRKELQNSSCGRMWK